MEDQRLAVHRAIVVVDVEGFGDQRRTNQHQVAVRDGLYRALQDAFGSAGIPWDDCGREDRGDGVFVLVPAEVPKALLAESLPPALVTALRAHNSRHPGPEQIRLRMALHAGEVHYDQHGASPEWYAQPRTGMLSRRAAGLPHPRAVTPRGRR